MFLPELEPVSPYGVRHCERHRQASDGPVSRADNSIEREAPPAASSEAAGALLRTWAGLRKSLISIPDREVLVSTRGFDVRRPEIVKQLEDVGRAFVTGYNTAAGAVSVASLAEALDATPPSHRGFVYEGASMGLAVADFLTPFSRLWREFAQTAGGPHIYMVYVGYGWALARLPTPVLPPVMRLDQPIRWLAMDGYGFHQGYFHWRRYVRDAAPPDKFTGYAARAFDQGLGRSLWFVQGADPDKVAQAIAYFAPQRAGDLWAGVGLAATYAGGAAREPLERLRALAGPHYPHLAQGAVFAAQARQRAGAFVEHNDLACRVLCDAPFGRISQIALECYPSGSGDDAGLEPYEVWRMRIRRRFGSAD